MTSQDPKAALWRYRQSMIDADIEGLARDPEAEALVARWDEAGVSPEEQIERLKTLFHERQRRKEPQPVK